MISPEILAQSVIYRGHTLKFMDFVNRFAHKKDLYKYLPFAFTGRTQYYINILNQHRHLKFFFSFNRSLFILNLFSCGVGWLVYKRMYMHALVWGMLSLIFHGLSIYDINHLNQLTALSTDQMYSRLSVILIYILATLSLLVLGNYLYLTKIARDIITGKVRPLHNSDFPLSFSICIVILVFKISFYLEVVTKILQKIDRLQRDIVDQFHLLNF